MKFHNYKSEIFSSSDCLASSLNPDDWVLCYDLVWVLNLFYINLIACVPFSEVGVWDPVYLWLQQKWGTSYIRHTLWISLYRCHWASEGTAHKLAAPWKLQLTLLLKREAVLLDGFVVHLQTLSLYPTAKSCFLCGSAVHLLWFWPSVPLCKAFEENVIFSCVRAEVWLDHQAQNRTVCVYLVSACVCLYVVRLKRFN